MGLQGKAPSRGALELNPNKANEHYFYGYLLLRPEKRMDRARRENYAPLCLSIPSLRL